MESDGFTVELKLTKGNREEGKQVGEISILFINSIGTLSNF